MPCKENRQRNFNPDLMGGAISFAPEPEMGSLQKSTVVGAGYTRPGESSKDRNVAGRRIRRPYRPYTGPRCPHHPTLRVFPAFCPAFCQNPTTLDFLKSSLLLSFKKEETNRIYPRMTCSRAAALAARNSAPASVNSSRVRNPHSTPQQGNPALWAVATSTLLSPT